MLEQEIYNLMLKNIRRINKLKTAEERVQEMIFEKEKIRTEFNDFLDDLFANVDLSNKNILNLEE